MVRPALAPIWSPIGMLQRARRLLRQPGDIILTLRIGLFIWRLPHRLRRHPLPGLLDAVRAGSRPDAPDIATGMERIIRLRTPWLVHHRFGSHNTCYVRALSLYRFLDAGDRDFRIHFVVEPARSPDERIRGHAWITVDNQILEEPGRLRTEGLTHEVYSHPARLRGSDQNRETATITGTLTNAGVRDR
ncbi:MAG: lasso peptide biosynthesis protein [Pseudomonadota bacterium]